MKYLKEVAIIFGITMAGEFLNYLLPLPVPAGLRVIYPSSSAVRRDPEGGGCVGSRRFFPGYDAAYVYTGRSRPAEQRG